VYKARRTTRPGIQVFVIILIVYEPPLRIMEFAFKNCNASSNAYVVDSNVIVYPEEQLDLSTQRTESQKATEHNQKLPETFQ
jgi:hypothetical protein